MTTDPTPTDPDPLRAAPGASERGSALVLAMICIILLSGTFLTLYVSVEDQQRSVHDRGARDLQLNRADMAIAKAFVLTTNNWRDYDDTERFIVGTADTLEDGARLTIERLSDPDDDTAATFRIESTGVAATRRDVIRGDPAASRRVEVILRIVPQPPEQITGIGAGAVVGLGNFKTNGAITVDGRDHAMNGSLRTDAEAMHSPGFTITGSLNQGGASKIGGGGSLPSKNASGDQVDTSTTFWNEFEGSTMPQDPGKLVGSTAANLKGHAVAHGTFFTLNGGRLEQHDGAGFTGLTYSAWLGTADATNGGDVVYIEGPPGHNFGQVDLPNNGGGMPNIVMLQESGWAASGTGSHGTSLGPVHVPSGGTFMGALIVDNIRQVNGNGNILGSVFAYNDNGANMSHFGNGAATIRFSSEVLGNLPAATDVNTPPVPQMQLWREMRADE